MHQRPSKNIACVMDSIPSDSGFTDLVKKWWNKKSCRHSIKCISSFQNWTCLLHFFYNLHSLNFIFLSHTQNSFTAFPFLTQFLHCISFSHTLNFSTAFPSLIHRIRPLHFHLNFSTAFPSLIHRIRPLHFHLSYTEHIHNISFIH